MTWATPEIREQKRREACRRYYDKNKDKCAEYSKAYYQANKERIAKLARQRYLIKKYLTQEEVDTIEEAVESEIQG